MKAYTNKLLIGISTAGDNEQMFLGQRLKYCRKVLDGTVRDEQYFIFMCCANPDEDGNIDYTSPKVHEMANPAYGVTIRPDEILNDSLQAQNDPQQRKDFFAKSLKMCIRDRVVADNVHKVNWNEVQREGPMGGFVGENTENKPKPFGPASMPVDINSGPDDFAVIDSKEDFPF